MNYLSAENISKAYGDKTLFENLYFGLNKGDKIALIAPNGAGKSTLLKIIAHQEEPDEGQVVTRDLVRIGYLKQETDLDPKLTINELIRNAGTKILSVIHDYENALKDQTENYCAETHAVFEQASHRMDEYGAWDYERRLKELLTLFNITERDQKIASLSGGQKKRLSLAFLLLDNPELLLLDEPTNQLDIEMIEWLEKYLSQSTITLLMVTHDRYFLDRVCNSIFELADSKIYHHKGNYAYFLEKKAEREVAFQTEENKMNRLLKKELEWIRRMPQARTTKSKSRVNQYYETKEKSEGKEKKQDLRLGIKMSRIGGKILEVNNVSKTYGDISIIKNFSYIFKKGERIGIIGKNGVGKTSFLNLMAGLEKPDSGKISMGETIVPGYYLQEGMKLKQDKRVIDVVKEIAEFVKLADGSTRSASQFLRHFMFPTELQNTLISALSGGEQRRLNLLLVLMKNPNLLILDEPTNDLDLYVLNTFEEFLMDFPGCLIVVSHDRYFLDKLTDHLFIFEGEGKIRDCYSNYTEYRVAEEKKEKLIKRKNSEINKLEKNSQAEVKVKEKTKLTYQERLDFLQLEKDIEKLEQRKAVLETELNSGNAGYQELEKLSLEITEIINQIDVKTQRWIDLSEFDNG